MVSGESLSGPYNVHKLPAVTRIARHSGYSHMSAQWRGFRTIDVLRMKCELTGFVSDLKMYSVNLMLDCAALANRTAHISAISDNDGMKCQCILFFPVLNNKSAQERSCNEREMRRELVCIHLACCCRGKLTDSGNVAVNNYRQVSNIRRTKSQHLKYSRTVLRLSLPNPLKPDVKSRMKM